MSSFPPQGLAGAGPRASATEAQWELHKNRIGELYVTEGRTADEVRGIMIADHGFDVTKRMYKQRFKTWGMARKNLKAIEYEAMKMVYDEILAREGVEVQFSAVRGIDIKMHRISDVRKELARPGSRKKSDQNKEEILARGLNHILERKEIRIIRPEQNILPGSEPSSTPSMGSCSMSLESESDQDTFTENEAAVMIPDQNSFPLYPFGSSAQTPELEKEADLWAMFADLMTTEYDPRLSNHLPPSIIPPQTEAMQDTCNWAWHLFETCIKTDENLPGDAAGEHRIAACNVFERMLATSNPHILSSLIHIACVFEGISGADNYRCILADCVELISKEPRNNQAYLIPYRYALACKMGAQAEIFQFGRELLNGTEHNGYRNQMMSSNYLVFQQFGAHHLLEHMQDAEGARNILVRCLNESSQSLERNHSVNVGCLNLLARAYDRLGQIPAAIDAYCDAAQRSEVVFGPRHPFRMNLVSNIAVLQVKLGMIVEVEENFRQVFSCRNELLGPGHSYTYSSAQDLQKFLKYHGRHHDAAQEEKRRKDLYREDRHWKQLSETDAAKIRRERRNAGLYWEKGWENGHDNGLFKYEFVMPREAYMRVRAQNVP